MFWFLMITWNMQTKPVSSSWVHMKFKTEADCRRALKTVDVSSDVAKNGIIVCREFRR